MCSHSANILLILTIWCGTCFTSSSVSSKPLFIEDTIAHKTKYKDALTEILEMIDGKKPYSFKRAVFITENAYCNNALDYEAFNKEIGMISSKLRLMINKRGLDKYRTAGNWAVFTFMTDSIPENEFKPYRYDFDDFMGENNWKNMFVSKLISSRKGNCHSLPYFYKIICNEMKTDAFLAVAPNHLYIKHIDEHGNWANLELTSGGFFNDQSIIKEMNIPIESIKSEIYLTPLNEKEEIAICLFDLASGYKNLFGDDEVSLNIINSGLNIYPKSPNLLMLKANWYISKIKEEYFKIDRNNEKISMLEKEKNTCVNQLDRLGIRNVTTERYEDWVNSSK